MQVGGWGKQMKEDMYGLKERLLNKKKKGGRGAAAVGRGHQSRQIFIKLL